MDETIFMELVKQWVSFPYALTFIFLCYGIFKMIKVKKIVLNIFEREVKISKKYVVLILAFLVAIPFYFLIDGEKNVVLMKLIVTYAIGTSIYELLIKQLDNYLSNIGKK